MRDLIGYVNDQKIAVAECKVTPYKLAKIVELLDNGTVNNKGARQLFKRVAQDGQEPESLVEKHGLKQMGSQEDLKKSC